MVTKERERETDISKGKTGLPLGKINSVTLAGTTWKISETAAELNLNCSHYS